MHFELAPLGIAVTIVEPGYFRTGFLNPSAMVKSEKRIAEYSETGSAELHAMLEKVNNNQPGDVMKGSKVIIDILTESGVAEGKKVPMRIALGSDAPPCIRGKMEDTTRLLDEWDSITTKTDH